MASIFPAGFRAPIPSSPSFISGLRSKQSPAAEAKAKASTCSLHVQQGDSTHALVSPKLAKRVILQEEVATHSEQAEIQSKANPAAMLPISSLRMKHVCLEDTIAKTPTMTPHALTETALRKSEDLLAHLAALGLSLDEDPRLEGDNDNAESDVQDLSPVRRSMGAMPADTVEVPVALLDMFVETWAKYQDLQAEALKAKLHGRTNSRASSLSRASTESSTTLEDDTASEEESFPSTSTGGSLLSPLPLPSMNTVSEPHTPASCAQLNELMEANAEKLRILHEKFEAFMQTSTSAEKAHLRELARAPVAACRPAACAVGVTNTLRFHY